MLPGPKLLAPLAVQGQRPELPTVTQAWLQHFSAPPQGAVTSSQPVGAAGVMQSPLLQVCPCAHAPQPPQWFGSFWLSTQMRLQQDCVELQAGLQPGMVVTLPLTGSVIAGLNASLESISFDPAAR